jgi:hypothetical protein
MGQGISGELQTYARKELLATISAAKSQVWMASPFLTRPIARELAESASKVRDRRLLTALVAGSVQVGALSPEALSILAAGGFELRSIRNLHAKVSIIDGSWGLVGSGNLTNAGLGSTEAGNVELGVILDRVQIEAATMIYDGWWEEAEVIDAEQLAQFAALPRTRPRGATVEKGVGPALEIPDPDALEAIFGNERQTASRQYWIKANYHRRNDDGRGWWHRGWISDAKKASYGVDDLILLYLGAKFDGPRRAPAIVRVSTECEYNPDFVAREGDPEARERWPYVTRVECVFEVPVASGVPLQAIDVSSSGLQGGRKVLSRAQFEAGAQFLLSATDKKAP